MSYRTHKYYIRSMCVETRVSVVYKIHEGQTINATTGRNQSAAEHERVFNAGLSLTSRETPVNTLYFGFVCPKPGMIGVAYNRLFSSRLNKCSLHSLVVQHTGRYRVITPFGWF